MACISIHALVKRATRAFTAVFSYVFISIHALVKRATNVCCTHLFVCVNFNPRPREEGDTCTAYDAVEYENFNPRPREEGDEFCDPYM